MDKSIAILTWGLQGGSLTNYTTALTQGLWEAGVHNISLLYLAAGPGSHVAIPDGVKIIPVGAKRARSSPFHLARCLKELKPDFLISVSAFINMPAILGWLLSGKGHTKLIISQHSTMSYKAYVEHKDDWKERLQPTLARLLYPLASGLHANSDAVLDDLIHTIGIKMPPERAIATPNPVNLEAIAQYSQAQPEHPWLQHKDKPVLISVARLAKQKNLPLLLNAFAQVRQSLDARLIILGEGPERTALEAQVKALGLDEHVSLPGFSPNPWCHMAHADAFVLSSEEEPFGLVLVEAMSCGTPVIATDAIGGGPKDVLGNGAFGFLVPTQDAQALANAILMLLSDADKRQHLSAVGQERAQQFQPKLVAQQWLSFFERWP